MARLRSSTVFASLASVLLHSSVAHAQQPAPVQAEPLASVLDVKSEEDLARVKKLGFDVKIRVVDAADGKPIKGVAFGMWDETAQTDADGIARLVRKVEHGMPAGLDTIVPLEHINRQVGISKDGKQIDVKQIAWPYSVHVSAAEMSSGVCVEKTLELVLQGKLVRGRYEIDTSELVIEQKDLEGMHARTELLVNGDYWFGRVFGAPGSIVTIGPLPTIPTHGYVRFGNHHFPLELHDEFNVSLKYEPAVQTVEVIWSDKWWFEHMTSEKDIAGAAFVRVTDGFVVSRAERPAAVLEPGEKFQLSLPTGKYVLIPGKFVLVEKQRVIAEAIRSGIDITQFGLPMIDVTNTGKPLAEVPPIVVKGSVLEGRTAMERIAAELEKRKAANDPATAPVGEIPARTPDSK